MLCKDMKASSFIAQKNREFNLYRLTLNEELSLIDKKAVIM